MYITSSSTISYQPTFKNKGFSARLTALQQNGALMEPDYSENIAPMDRRRMSAGMKMSICCMLDCLAQSMITQPEAIIVGTAMGCSLNTKIFLEKIHSAGDGLIAPTSFISSTHNTIAGQISLLLKNHAYNNTHTHNSLSFEHALIDASLCLNEGCTSALVGAADEFENDLYNMNERLNLPQIVEASGASFFTIQSKINTASAIILKAVDVCVLATDLQETTLNFLESNQINIHSIDLVLFSQSTNHTSEILERIFPHQQKINYQNLSGTYFTNSAFALHFACDMLEQNKAVKSVLILNNLIPENLGLMYIQKEEIVG
ncbi:MAG: beta-ketoacyl synthase chain length factor [Bacteroidetes bacterium]|nr:beta-ketoacyl synthase chain length factor [Bacteroidota bacterium]